MVKEGEIQVATSWNGGEEKSVEPKIGRSVLLRFKKSDGVQLVCKLLKNILK